ncbi:MAG: hypothetical protein O2782_14445 [bacterium]|nr:hypothetical protein [bacterium]
MGTNQFDEAFLQTHVDDVDDLCTRSLQGLSTGLIVPGDGDETPITCALDLTDTLNTTQTCIIVVCQPHQNFLYPPFESVGVLTGKQSARLDHCNTVGHSLHFVHHMRGQQDRAPLLLNDLHDALEKVASHEHIQARRRFVENQQFRVMTHGQHQRQLCAHAPGQVLHLALRIQAELIEQVGHVLVVPVRVERGREAHQFPHPHPAVELGRLGDVANALPQSQAILDRIEPQDSHTASGRSLQPEQSLDGRRLAGAVAPEETEDPASLHCEIESIHRRRIAVAMYEIFDPDDYFGHRLVSP